MSGGAAPSRDSLIAALLLTNRIVDVGEAPLSAKEFWALLERVPDPAALLSSDPANLTRSTGLDPELAERAVRLVGAATAHAAARDVLEQEGIASLSALDERFPARLITALGPGCPASLLVAGPPALLSAPAIGVVGSRAASESAARVAEGAALEAAGAGFAIVSGLARGIDETAMVAALRAEGTAIGFPADGLHRVARKGWVRAAVHEASLVLASPYGPDAPFRVGNAMGRNRLIYANARVTLVVTSDRNGGTWSGATEALRRGFGPVAVWLGDGAGPGNEGLLAAGATPVTSLEALVDLARHTKDLVGEGRSSAREVADASQVSTGDVDDPSGAPDRRRAAPSAPGSLQQLTLDVDAVGGPRAAPG